MRKSVTIRDVAEKAGFSFQTVSRVLNGKAHLHKAETVKEIERAANELGYVTNFFAKGMQSGKTCSVGLIIDPFTDSFTEEIFRGAHDELLNYDYLPILLMHRKDMHDEKLVQRLAERRVEGLIIRPYQERMAEVSAEIEAHKMPVVSVDYTLSGEQQHDFVGTADSHGGELAANYLVELGHRKILGIFTAKESLQLRRSGFLEALKKTKDSEFTEIDWSLDDSKNRDLLTKIFFEKDRPTAIFASGDYMLPQIYRAILDLNLRIPDDVSVIGFGNEGFSQYMIPPATTLNQDAYEIGRQAARLLMERINGVGCQYPAKQVRFEPNLIVRESTARII